MALATFVRAAAFVVLACAIACRQSEPVPAGGTVIDTSTLGSATRTLLARLVERRQACYGASAGYVAWKKRSAEPRASALDGAEASGRISYDRARADLCAASLDAASCPEIEDGYTELDPRATRTWSAS